MTEEGFCLLYSYSLKCAVVRSIVIVVPLKNTLVGMKNEAKQKSLPTGLYYS